MDTEHLPVVAAAIQLRFDGPAVRLSFAAHFYADPPRGSNPLAQVDTHPDVALMQTPSRGVNPMTQVDTPWCGK